MSDSLVDLLKQALPRSTLGRSAFLLLSFPAHKAIGKPDSRTPHPSTSQPFERAAGDAQLRGPGEGDLQCPQTLACTLGPHSCPQSRLL